MQPMHSPSAITEHVSLNLAGFFLLDPVQIPEGRREAAGPGLKYWKASTDGRERKRTDKKEDEEEAEKWEGRQLRRKVGQSLGKSYTRGCMHR